MPKEKHLKLSTKFKFETEAGLTEAEKAGKPKREEPAKKEIKPPVISKIFKVETEASLQEAEKAAEKAGKPKREEPPKFPEKPELAQSGAFKIAPEVKIPKLEKPTRSSREVAAGKKEKPTKIQKEKEARPSREAMAGKEEKPVYQLDKLREAYVKAKLELEKNPEDKKAKKEFESAQKDYLKERQEDLRLKAGAAEKELKGKTKEEKERELRKAGSLHILSEFKKFYDLKTHLLAESRLKDKPWLLRKLEAMGEAYQKLSLSQKLAISGVLLAGGVTAGAIGGGTGLALATLVGGGRFTQRMFSSSAMFVGLEGLIKKSQEKTMMVESQAAYDKLIKESFDKQKFSTPQRLVKFLQAKDLLIERKAIKTGEELEKRAKQFANRRYLIAGTVGFLTASGVTGAIFQKLGEITGFTGEVSHLLEKAGLAGPEVPAGASPEAIAKAAEMKADFTATVREGGSISKAAHSLVLEGKISKEEFLRAWNNSSVKVHGVKVPIKDVALSHAGDQVIYEPGVGGGTGHFEVVDYAKDKLSLGTAQDLEQVYNKLGKEPPAWVEDAVKKPSISRAFSSGSLFQQEQILDNLIQKGGKESTDLFVNLTKSSAHEKAIAIYESNLKEIGMKPEEYRVVKDMNVGEFLKKRGRSWFMDYFFKPDSVPFASTAKDATPVSEILHQRKLAEFLRKALPSVWEKQMTIEQFLKSFVV